MTAEYAAAFFLLGGSLKDAVNVCIRNLNDFQLAVAIARVVEQGDDGPVLKSILEGTVVPLAFKNGNRWLASWAFWLLNRRDLAVRVLVVRSFTNDVFTLINRVSQTPMQDIVSSLNIDIPEIGEPHYDDPSHYLICRSGGNLAVVIASNATEHPLKLDSFLPRLRKQRLVCGAHRDG